MFQGDHNGFARGYDQAVAAENATPFTDFFVANWAEAMLNATFTDHTGNQLPPAMSTAIVMGIVANCIVAPLPAFPAERHEITDAVILALRTAITDIPVDVARSQHPISNQLEYCSALLEAVKQHINQPPNWQMIYKLKKALYLMQAELNASKPKRIN
jgi:hypothetical protein